MLVGSKLRAAAVRRPRLDDTLDGIPPGGVGLLVAPAGSGKSVLLGQWMGSSSSIACRVHVTSLHDDPVVLARSLTSAVAAVAPDFDPHVTDTVAAVGSELGSVFVSRFLAAVEELGCELVIVLDDVHRLANAAVWADLGELIQRLPANVRFVMGARWDPPLRLQALQLLSLVVEIRANDLAFNTDEARGLIEGVSGRRLTDAQVEELVDRTDGWGAGLQLAAISIQRFADVNVFIEGFTGSNKLVADYLAEEVIEDLEPEVRRFLLHTSVLEWLAVDVCNAVTGESDAAEMLDLLARRSLFLVQPERDGDRLRYHHLFADLLRDRLRVAEPDQEPRLRRRAAAYLLANGEVADAVEQLLAVGDGSQVVKVINERGQDFFEREENLTLARWLATARTLDVDAPVVLDINLLAAQLAGHDTDAAVETYRRLRRRTDLEAGEAAAAAALYACLVLDDLPACEVFRATDEATELLRTPDAVGDFLGIGGRDSVEFLAASMRAMAHLHEGELAESARGFEGALHLPAAQYRLWKVFALGGRALALALAGRGAEARADAASALALAEANGIAHHHGLAYSHFALARVSLDEGDRHAATYHLQETETRVRRSRRAALRSLQELMAIEHATGGSGTTRTRDESPSSVRATFGPTLFVERHRAKEVQLLVRCGRLGQARAHVEAGPLTLHLRPAVIDLELASGDVGAARRALDGWDDRPEPRCQVERLLGAAAVLNAEGQTRLADDAVQDALDRAEPHLLRQPFLEQPTVLQIVRRRASGSSQPFARSVLLTAAQGQAGARRELVQPLTDREQEILSYLPTRLSNIEIAAHLYVSVNTLKSHLRHIYTKLEAANRDEAVAQATEIGLL